MAIRVFLVEDQKHLQDSMGDLLASLGGFALTGSASTEAEALLWLDEHLGGWDLAIIDLVLEQGTGMGVIARCTNRAPGASVVVFSEYATPGIRKHCLKLGADAVFQKSTELAAFIGYCTARTGVADTGPPRG